MSEVTRRELLAATAGALAANAALDGAAQAEQAAPAPLTHKFRLAAMKPTAFPGGTVREATVHNFPASTEMSGALLTINPGGLRELHWHPNAAEWDYVLSGKLRITVFSPKESTGAGHVDTFELETGDIAFIPRGYGHYIENIGRDEARLLVVFNNGAFDTISSTGWLAATPKEVLATNFGVPAKTFANFPKQAVFLAPKPN